MPKPIDVTDYICKRATAVPSQSRISRLPAALMTRMHPPPSWQTAVDAPPSKSASHEHEQDASNHIKMDETNDPMHAEHPPPFFELSKRIKQAPRPKKFQTNTENSADDAAQKRHQQAVLILPIRNQSKSNSDYLLPPDFQQTLALCTPPQPTATHKQIFGFAYTTQ